MFGPRDVELDDGERYCYAGLVACSLNFDQRMCSDVTWGCHGSAWSPTSRAGAIGSANTGKRKAAKTSEALNAEFAIDFLLRLAKHLSLPDRRKESLLHILQGDVPSDMALFAAEFQAEGKDAAQWQVMQDVVLFAVGDGRYDARARVAIRRVTDALGMEWRQVVFFENAIANELTHQGEEDDQRRQEREQREKKSRWKKVAAVAGATVGGGVLIGLTAGLAAPFIAAGAGAVVGASGGAFLASTGGIVLITSLFGGAGAGMAGKAMMNRMGDLKEFDFTAIGAPEPSMHVIIAVTGWVRSQEDDFAAPWRGLQDGAEQYSVRWESQELAYLGEYMYSKLSSSALGIATTQVLSQTVLHSLLAAVTWPLLLINAAEVIDNAWSRCQSRADRMLARHPTIHLCLLTTRAHWSHTGAGLVLADTLAAHVQGHRPVTLTGFSLGARVVFAALEDLATRPEPVVGVVQDVYLFGAPVTSDPVRWQRIRNIVAGRIVNCYTEEDWILGFVHRTLSAAGGVAGMHAIEGVTVAR